MEGFGDTFGPLTQVIPFYDSIVGLCQGSIAMAGDTMDLVSSSMGIHSMRKYRDIKLNTEMEMEDELDFEDDFDFEFKDADEMNQEITLDEGTEDAVEDIAEETVSVSEDEE